MSRRALQPEQVVRGPLTAAERGTIERLAERSLSPSQIAFRLNRHRSTVNSYMARHGLRAPTAKTFSFMRRGCLVRSFSPEEDAFLTVLRVQGYKASEISRLISLRHGHPRSRSVVSTRLSQLAARAEGA